MRIVVNDIAADSGGAMTVLRDFYSFVCENDHENEWIFLLNERYFEETENVKIKTLPEIKNSRIRKLLFDFVTGRKYIRTLSPDVVFSLQNIITFGLEMPQAVYIHQSIPFQSVKRFSFFRSAERKLAVVQYLIGGIIKLSARKSDCVIVQTEWMKAAVCRMCRLPPSKVMTSLPAVKRGQTTQADLPFEKTTFFYPTADTVYKNNDCVYRASKMLDRKGIAHRAALTLPPEKSEGSLVCVGRLPYEAVMARYQQSTLVFPSYIETFGFPLAEARSAGTIVLASDTPFSREVLAGYGNAYFFDPFQPEELAALMEQVATGKIKIWHTDQDGIPADNAWKQVIKHLLSMGA